MSLMEPGTLPRVPPGLEWSPGWCAGCMFERDVTVVGSLPAAGITVPLALCRWCLDAAECRLLAALEWNTRWTPRRQRLRQLNNWAGSLVRRRAGQPSAGRHRAAA